LSIGFKTDKGVLRAVDDISYQIAPGKTLGLVGESGCGKSTTALALMGLLPSTATVGGQAHFSGQELFAQTESQWRRCGATRSP
jgi:ABC-type dipeptide/oligopeptide/nickel transport system ATPase component